MDPAGHLPKALWSIRECAQYLAKSERWLRSALTKPPDASGSIPHVRVGANIRFFPADIESWVRAGCPPAATFAAWRESAHKRARSA